MWQYILPMGYDAAILNVKGLGCSNRVVGGNTGVHSVYTECDATCMGLRCVLSSGNLKPDVCPPQWGEESALTPGLRMSEAFFNVLLHLRAMSIDY